MSLLNELPFEMTKRDERRMTFFVPVLATVAGILLPLAIIAYHEAETHRVLWAVLLAGLGLVVLGAGFWGAYRLINKYTPPPRDESSLDTATRTPRTKPLPR